MIVKRFLRWIAKLIFLGIAISILWVWLYKWFAVPVTPLMVYQKLTSKKSYVFRHQWVPIEKISKNLQLAVICSEDQRFATHYGFDAKAIKHAIDDRLSGKRLRGASTISQQTAKNVFLWPQRSWVRKGLEIYFTILIEIFWSKERILEVYLNSIEMGEGIFGAQAASQFWFGINAESLDKDQAATLAAILPNPIKYHAVPTSSYIQKRKNWIQEQMGNYGVLQLENP